MLILVYSNLGLYLSSSYLEMILTRKLFDIHVHAGIIQIIGLVAWFMLCCVMAAVGSYDHIARPSTC